MTMSNQVRVFDIAICGGGLAGLTLARQIKLTQPERTVLLIERTARPLTQAAHKVGESSVELGAHYLGEKLQLHSYFTEQHFKKLGLRYFFGDSTGPLEKRPEFGLSSFPTVSSYQIDRGKLENDLRSLNQELGIELIEGKIVKAVNLAPSGEQMHEVVLEQAPGVVRTNGRAHFHETIQARWVVDAMGRRRYLQKKLGLAGKTKGKCSSSWFRVEGRIDLDDLVTKDLVAESGNWHARVPNRQRYFSTNHLMGDGYWVWLIPLVTGYTSVGIVTQESIHPFETYNTYERAIAWLRKHEPTLATHLKQCQPVDFRCMRRYSHTSRQVFSEQRWACVGEAGVFADPFYSPGTDMIGFANSITNEMIKLDFAGQLTAEQVSEYNRFYIGMNNALTTNIQAGYPFFGNAMAMVAKLLWDNSAAWAYACPQMFNSTYLDPEKSAQFRKATTRFFSLTQRMQRLFVEWSTQSAVRLSYEFMDYLSLNFLCEWRLRNLQSGKSTEELIADQHYNMARFEELAQALFLLAVEDVMPEQLERFPDPVWLNAWRVGLDPERWEKERLFEPTSAPRDFSAMYTEIRSRFFVKEAKADLPESLIQGGANEPMFA